MHKKYIDYYWMELGMKVIIVVRTDLGMGKGKIAGQVAHACTGLIWFKGAHKSEEDIKEWMEESNQKKIVLKVKDEEHLIEIVDRACVENVAFYCVRDAGMTQIEEDTLTCASIGPMTDE